MKNYKRVLSALLVLLMCLSLFPSSAIASDEAADAAEPAEAVENTEPAAEPAEEITPQDVEPEDIETQDDEGDGGPILTGATGTLLYGNTYRVEINPGQTKTLSVAASGDGLTYDWYSRGTGWEWTSLDQHGTSITATCLSGGPLKYRCEIEDSSGNMLTVNFEFLVNSNMYIADAPAELTNFWSSEDYPNIKNWNCLVYAELGASVELYVQVGGLNPEEMADVTYEWEERVIDEETGRLKGVPTGVTTAAFPPFEMEGKCSYQCTIRDGYGTIINVAFDVWEGSPGPGLDPDDSPLTLADAKGDFQYKDEDEVNWNFLVSASAGEEVTLWVEIGGYSVDDMEDVTFSWQTPVRNENGEIIDFEPIPGENDTEYTFTFEQNETYMCMISDSYGKMLFVFFHVEEGGPGPSTQLFLYPMYGTSYLRTAAGIPVTMMAMLLGGDDLDFEYEWYSWDAAAQKWVYLTYQSDEEAALTVSPTVTTTYQLRATEYDDVLAYLNFTVDVVPAGQIVNLDQDYYVLAPGDDVTLIAPSIQPYWCVSPVWVNENEAVVDIDPDDSVCTVTARKEGTSFVSWVVYALDEVGEIAYDDNDDPVVLVRLRCRIDVLAGSIEEAIVTDNYSLGLHLPNTAVTTNIYSLDYAQFPILIDLENNQIDPQGLFIDRKKKENGLDDNGAIIEKAWFTDETTQERFALRVVDDRTLEIVPNIDFKASKEEINAAAAAVKGKYTSAVTVKFKDVDQTVDTDNKLTLTVKKTLPKVTAAAVKLNSFIPDDWQLVSMSPANIESIRLDPLKTIPAGFDVDTIPSTGGQEYLRVTFTGERSKNYSGKLYALAIPAGWTVEVPVTVSVQAKKTAPKLKVNGTVTINPRFLDFGGTTVSTTLPEIAVMDPPEELEPKVTKITEGKAIWPSKNETLEQAPISCSFGLSNPGGGEYYLEAWIRNSETFDFSKAHTYKVTVDVGGATATATVKVLAASAVPGIKAKVSGTIDDKISRSFATVKCTATNAAGLIPRLRVYQDLGADGLADVSDLFFFARTAEFEYRVGERFRMTVPKGYTYYVVPRLVQMTEVEGEMVEETVCEGAKVKLNIKWPENRATITATLKAAGSIDLIRPDSAVALTTTLKNCYNTGIYPVDLVFSTDKAGLNVLTDDPEHGIDEVPFNVSINYSTGKLVVTLKDEYRGVVKTTDTYYVHIDMVSPELRTDGQEVTTKPVQIKLTKGSAKITATEKTVQLLKNDLYSYANIGLVVPGGCTPIKEVKLDAKSEARFDLVDNGGGSVELHIDPANPLTTKGTAKILVTLEGNTTGKPDATISVSVKFA